MTLWAMFDAVAHQYSERVAIEVQRANALEQWSYAELHALALAYADQLASAGVEVGDRCAILADNDARWCAAFLAIVRQGAIAVPLDTNDSAAQLATILADAAPRVLYVNDRLAAVSAEGLATLPWVTLSPLHGVKPTKMARPAAQIDGSQAAVILYTSGTTADPKGVVLTHANLLAARDAAFSVLRVSETDRVLGVLPLFHALAQLATLLLPFAAGARVVFLETATSTELVRALVDRQITISVCVPQLFYVLHERVFAEGAGSRLFRRLLGLNVLLRRMGLNLGRVLFGRIHQRLAPHMRFFVIGGAKFEPAIGRDFYALGFTVLQAYGLTETSGAATLTQPADATLDTVGRVLPGQEVRILPGDQPELDGEIVIRGPIVMQGYFKRADATREVLRDGWLHTGDLGHLDSQNRLTITGRKTELVVLPSGKKICPEEVELHYRRSVYIREICVLGLPDEGSSTCERLYAVVVPNMALLRERRIANAGDVLRFEMEGQSIDLPHHRRVLAYEVWFEPLPRTPTGELKRHEIAKRVLEKRRAQTAAAGESCLSIVWQDDDHARLAVDMIRRHASGRRLESHSSLELDLGLDSMARVELMDELERRFGMRIPADQAHQILTVQQLIEAVRPVVPPGELPVVHDSWSGLLGNLPEDSDPLVAPLNNRYRAVPLMLFPFLRIVRPLVARMQVSGLHHLPSSGPFIISPNHQSYLDPFFVCSALPYRVFRLLFFVGATEYFETPLTAWLAHQVNLIPVDPDAKLIPAMRAGAYGLSRGRILVLFPEGERSIDGTVKHFKKGASILSRQLQVPIVPVAIAGVFELWPRNRPFNWRLLIPGSGHRVRVAFGAPMTVAGDTDYADAAKQLQQRVELMWRATIT